MLTRFGKWLPAMLVMSGFALLGAPQSARATLELEVRADDFDFNTAPYVTGPISGGAIHYLLFVDQNALGAPGTYATDAAGHTVVLGADQNLTVTGSLVLGAGNAATPIQAGFFLVNGSASQSNSPGLPGTSVTETVTSSSINVVNNSGGTHTNFVTVGDTGFTALTGGVQTATASGEVVGGGNVVVTTVDNGSNAQFGGTSNNPLAPGPNVYGFNGTVFTGLYSGTAGPVAIPFTAVMAKTIEFDITLDANSQLDGRLNGITNRGIAAVVPEPGTMALAFAGLPVLGVIAWRRRRRDGADA